MPPAAIAFATVSSICSLLSTDRQVIDSVVVVASAISPLMKSLKRASSSSITKMFSSTTMHAASLSEYSWLNAKPSSVKNAFDAARSLTGRFTKIMRIAVSSP